MPVSTRDIALELDGTPCTGQLAWNKDSASSRPGILVAHTIRGRTAFEDEKARNLAELGYAALSIDLYGDHTRDDPIDEMRSHMNDLRDDRPGLASRLLSWHAALKAAPEVRSSRTAAIGFCFGGLCVLDLARANTDIAGVVSFHGILKPPAVVADTSATRVLVLHGWDDPLAPPEDVLTLSEELTRLGVDWQLHAYGNTVHAFTNPQAGDSSAGTVYNPAADRRSHAAMRDFLAELFVD